MKYKLIVLLSYAFFLLSYTGNIVGENNIKEEVGIEKITDYDGIFTDRSFSVLKDGISLKEINRIADEVLKEIAIKLFNNSYEGAEFRIQNYEAYQPLEELRTAIGCQQLYSKFVNPTGIRIEANKEITIYAEGIENAAVKVLVANFGTNVGNHPKNGRQYKPSKEYYHQLKNGKNTFKSSIPGNLYISYYTSDYLTAPIPTVHIVSGEVCGYFDVEKHNNEKWKELLELPYEVLDIKGKHIGLAYPREILKEYCPNNGVELIKNHDAVVKAEWELIGLYKYNKVPKNPMFAGWNPHQTKGAYAGKNGVYNQTKGLERWCSVIWKDPIDGGWGLYHELGHINEMKGFRWSGTGEVVNNLYSCWAEYLLQDSKSHRYEFSKKESIGDGLGKVINGPYHIYLNNVVHRKGVDWNSFANIKDKSGRNKTRAKVCFLWQLQLYFGVILKLDAYQDYFEILRNNPLPNDTKTKQLNYYMFFCDAVKMDLTEIFEKGKMLVPYAAKMGKEQVNITTDDINKAKAYVSSKNYPKPETSTLYYLTTRTLKMYKNKTPMANAQEGTGIYVNGNRIIVDNIIWTGAVGFEVYNNDDKIMNSSVAYTGPRTYVQNDNNTMVAFPEDATYVKAVAWDGSKQIIYQK